MRLITFSTLILSSLISARPSLRQRQPSGFQLQNDIDAFNLNNRFASLTTNSSCSFGNACVDNQFAQCVSGRYVLSPCGPGLICTALPLVNSPGTSVTCTVHAGLSARIANTALPAALSASGSSNSSSAQTSLTLVSSVVAPNFSQDGLNTSTSEAGEVASLTSTNNFINWCATVNLPITNGQQIRNGSCNPAPMGAIPAATRMPSSKFVTPHNLVIIPPNTTFQITLAIRNLATGLFVNPFKNYYAAPQQLDSTTGLIQGHSHVVIEALESLNQTTPTNPTQFAFFVTLNSKADPDGYLYANVTGGLPDGTYRMSTIMTAANHQPLALPVAKRGVSDDTIYFIVTA